MLNCLMELLTKSEGRLVKLNVSVMLKLGPLHHVTVSQRECITSASSSAVMPERIGRKKRGSRTMPREVA